MQLYPFDHLSFGSYQSSANMFLRLDSDAMYRCPSLLTAQVMRWDTLRAWSPARLFSESLALHRLSLCSRPTNYFSSHWQRANSSRRGGAEVGLGRTTALQRTCSRTCSLPGRTRRTL
jgi:hypothetical protein